MVFLQRSSQHSWGYTVQRCTDGSKDSKRKEYGSLYETMNKQREAGNDLGRHMAWSKPECTESEKSTSGVVEKRFGITSCESMERVLLSLPSTASFESDSSCEASGRSTQREASYEGERPLERSSRPIRWTLVACMPLLPSTHTPERCR